MFRSQTKSTHRPPHPNKRILYLRRSIQITQDSSDVIRKINIKNLHLRKINEMATCLNYSPDQLNQRQTIHKKLLKSVSHLQIATTTGKYWVESLKATKRVKNLSIYSEDVASKPSNVPSYLKRLSKNVKSISLYIEKYTEEKVPFYYILKGIRIFKNLEYFGREFQISPESEVFRKEAKIMENYIKRLPQANIFKYEQFFSDENGMKGERAISNRVTGLCFSIFEQPNPPSDEVLDYLKEEEESVPSTLIRDDEAVGFDSTILDIRQPETRIQEEIFLLKETMKPLYQFALFPGLQKLDLTIAENDYPLDSFICEGFASLKNLTSLQLKVMDRPFGSIFIFKALLELPKLLYLDFSFSEIQDLELQLFCQFLQNQKDLTDLKLSLKNWESIRIRQEEGPLKILTTLNGMQKLKSLSLILPSYSISSLSEVFGKVRRINQLQSLEINASGRSPDWGWKDVKGLCRFLRMQKESITRLNLMINLEEFSLINELARPVAELKGLKDLKISFGHGYHDIPRDLTEEESKKIAEMFRGLENLENLCLGLKSYGVELFVEILRVLGKLKGLRRLDVGPTQEIIGTDYERTIGEELVKMENVKKIKVDVGNEEFGEENDGNEEILRMVEEFNRKQSLRCDLMF